MASVAFESVRKTFGKTIALKDVDLLIRDGEFMVLLGPSGCGKTTLLRCLAGLERIDGGTVRIGDADVGALSESELVAFRNRQIGFVFQFHHLLPEFSALENAEMPLRIARIPQTAATKPVPPRHQED